VTQQLQPSQFSIDTVGATASTFILNIPESATIITWIGLLLALASPFLRGRHAPSSVERKIFVYLLSTAAMFILLFSIARGLNYRHYIMTSHLSAAAIAGLGWAIWADWLGSKWGAINRLGISAGIATLLAVLQLFEAAPFFPYFYTYYNPLYTAMTGQAPISNYGEGLEAAARYLAQKPGSESLKVFSYRGRGPFSYFFPGKTIILNPLFMDEPGMPVMFERLEEADYIVITDTLEFRTAGTGLFVQTLKLTPPEHSIYIKGVSPIRIYRVADLPPSFYEALSK
jgi:hypothetical protein